MDIVLLGKHVRQRRMELGMTQEELAEKAGISTSFVGHIERARKSASLDTWCTICDCLGVSLDWIVYGKNEVKCDGTHCEMIRELEKLIETYS